MSDNKKLELKNTLYEMLDETTEKLLNTTDTTERRLLEIHRSDLQQLIDICKNRNRF